MQTEHINICLAASSNSSSGLIRSGLSFSRSLAGSVGGSSGSGSGCGSALALVLSLSGSRLRMKGKNESLISYHDSYVSSWCWLFPLHRVHSPPTTQSHHHHNAPDNSFSPFLGRVMFDFDFFLFSFFFQLASWNKGLSMPCHLSGGCN